MPASGPAAAPLALLCPPDFPAEPALGEALAGLPRLRFDELANHPAELIFWLPRPIHFPASSLEDFAQALQADPELAFVMPRQVFSAKLEDPSSLPAITPAQFLDFYQPTSHWTDLAQETYLNSFCEQIGPPPMLARKSFLLDLRPWFAPDPAHPPERQFAAWLRQQPKFGLTISETHARFLSPVPAKHGEVHVLTDFLPIHPRLLLKPNHRACAPLLPARALGIAQFALGPAPTILTQRHRRRHLVQLLPYIEMGGADKFALDLCRALPEYTDWQVSVLTTDPHPNRWLGEARRWTADVHELPSFLPPHAQPAAIAAHLESRRADALLLTNSFSGYRLLPWLAHHCPQVTLADYLHVEHEHWKSGGHPRFSVLYHEWLDATFTSSQHLLEWCAENGHDRRGLQVVPTNIDPVEWDPSAFDAAAIRAEHQVPESDCLIVVAMRLVYQKQPDLLLEVLRELEAQNLPFTCLIAGDGEQFETLSQGIAEAGLRCSRLLGALPNAEIKRLLAAADLFALPTMMEGIALSLFEAMAMETVPVAAAVGGQAELVTPDCGLLIDRRHGREQERADYVEALRQLIADPARRQQMQRACRQRIVEHFSLRHMAEQLAAGLEAAADHRAPRPALTASQAETLGVEAVEHSHAQQVIDYHSGLLKERYQHRLAQRDRKIAQLEEKLKQRAAESAPSARKTWWRK